MSAAHDIFADDFEDQATDADRISWPSPAWRGRHIEFARDVLGKRTLAKHQIEILDAYYSPGRIEIVCCTGQKMGKTEDLLIIMLCDFATVERLNFYLFGPTIDWIDEAIWPRFVPDALAAYYPCAECMPAHRAWCALVEADPLDKTQRPERCPKCSPLIPSELKDPKDPSKGRKSEWLDEKTCEGGLRDRANGRAIRGYTSIKEGGKGGFSGNVRFACDESSDVSDTTRETIRGNMSGGGKFIAFGNLLYVTGWFARAFKSEREQYSKVIQISSRLSPNCRGTIRWSDGIVTANDNAGRPVPGMATRDDIEANLVAWKKKSNYILARIDAKPPEIVEGQLADMGRVAVAEKRWNPHDATGLLQLGVDVARARDRLAIASRRGQTILEIVAEALHQDDHRLGVEKVLEIGRKWRKPHERPPRLVYDASGPEGAAFGKELRAQKADEFFEIYPVQMAHPPRNRKLYDKRRDELAVGFANWLKHGSIPMNTNLEAQIEATTAKRVEVSYGSSGQKWEVYRVISNDELRPHLDGDSPDERNACELAVWDVDGSEAQDETPPPAETRPDSPQAKAATPAKKRSKPANDDFEPIDAYGGADSMLSALWGQS